MVGTKKVPLRFISARRLVVEERAVLDRVDAGADGALGALGAVGVRGHLSLSGVGLVDQRVELRLGELRANPRRR